MRSLKYRFAVMLFFSCLAVVVVGGAGSLLFLPWVYSAEVKDGEQVVLVRAPQGGIVRSLRVRHGDTVRADTIIAEIVTTDIQPPDALVAKAILYKRVENARYESQRGGLKQILLKPDLRARLAVDRDYARFVGEQRRLFRAFQSKLRQATKSLGEERSRLDIQVHGMEGEIVALSERRVSLERKVGTSAGSELRTEVKRNRRALRRDRKQLEGLRRKVRANVKAMLETTLRVRREESVDMEEVRAALNALYARMGLPANAFDRLDFADVTGGGQRLRRLIAGRAGRVARVNGDVYPGDVVGRGEVLAEILPDASRSEYRLKLDLALEDEAEFVVRGIAGGEMGIRSLRCGDFPKALRWQGEMEGDVLFLSRALLRSMDFPSVRLGGRCVVETGLDVGLRERGYVVLGLLRGVWGGGIDFGRVYGEFKEVWSFSIGVGERLWGRLDFLRGEGRIERTGIVLEDFVDGVRDARVR